MPEPAADQDFRGRQATDDVIDPVVAVNQHKIGLTGHIGDPGLREFLHQKIFALPGCLDQSLDDGRLLQQFCLRRAPPSH